MENVAKFECNLCKTEKNVLTLVCGHIYCVKCYNKNNLCIKCYKKSKRKWCWCCD